MATRSRSHSTLRQRSFERANKLSQSMPSTRGCSPASANRRVAKLNLYLSKSARNSTENLSTAAGVATGSLGGHTIKRWDGNRRMTTRWNSIRRDPELWFTNADCLVHFYGRGQSRRGPSLRVPLSHIESSNCEILMLYYLSEFEPVTPSSVSDSDQQSDAVDYFSEPSPAKYELHIPAPSHLSREEAFMYHLTTRNFFAWMFEKPLVGERLGDSLIYLLQRMHEWRFPNSQGNETELVAYLDSQGYTDFRDCSDHALAILHFAEKIQNQELWTDAFVHCTGMWEHLDRSAEFEHVSRTSQALISRAHLEMDLRLERAGASLGNFLEDDLSGAYLGLGKDAQMHLERFRSFLHTYYVRKHGYWPPTTPDGSSTALPKLTCQTMYSDFRNLYAFLVDLRSSNSMQHNMPVDGGICVFQNIQAFDKRRKYASLPRPLPLVPKLPAQLGNRLTFGKMFGNKQAKIDRRVKAWDALSAATNPRDREVVNCGLVREYANFEKQITMREETAVSCADARKVRWILVYAILQTLISVNCAPQEVRDTEGVSYALCCQTAGTPPWLNGSSITRTKARAIRPTSLGEKLLELGPDMDVVSARPSPLIIPQKAHKTAYIPQTVSVSHSLSVKSPQPIRTPSLEFLDKRYSDLSPIDCTDGSMVQSSSMNSLDPISTSPFSHHSDLATSSTSDPETGIGGWSSSSSEDGMEHISVNGSDSSDYGDDEGAEKPRSWSSLKPASRKVSIGSFRPGSCNPEVDRYVRS